MNLVFDIKKIPILVAIIFSIFLLIACSENGGDSSGSVNSQSVLTGTYSLRDFSIQSGGQVVWASQVLESFAMDCIIHDDGYMELSGCTKIPGEPEDCGTDTGMIEGDTLTITAPGCTYSATVKMGDGNIAWEFPPSCGIDGDGPSVWHWDKVSDTTPNSLLSAEGELINMIAEAIKMVQ